MPINYHLDKDRGLLVTHVTGRLDDRELIDALDRVMEETDGASFFRPHLFVIDEHTLMYDVTLVGLMRLKEAVEAWGKAFPGRDVKTAVVAHHDDQAAIAKLWQALADAHQSIGTEVKLFTSEDAAIAWLST